MLSIGTFMEQGNYNIYTHSSAKQINLNVSISRIHKLQIFVTNRYRLYKEEPPNRNDEHRRKKEKDRKKKKKDKKKKKKHKKSRRESISSDEDVPNSTWSVVCLTEKDWNDLTAKYKKSKKKLDKELYETLNDNFLPEIVKMFAEREREEKRKLMMMGPKRTSNRIERKRLEQEDKDRLLAEKVT